MTVGQVLRVLLARKWLFLGLFLLVSFLVSTMFFSSSFFLCLFLYILIYIKFVIYMLEGLPSIVIVRRITFYCYNLDTNGLP
jgi:hypothetical protein